jgi:hypothetical protein
MRYIQTSKEKAKKKPKMYNPFEKDTKEHQIYSEIVKTLTEDDRYTPVELMEMTHRCMESFTLAPDKLKYEQLNLFDPSPS